MNNAALIDKVMQDGDVAERRSAFIALLRGSDWREVLAPHVLSRHPEGGAAETAVIAAPIVAADEDKVQRCLELTSTRFGQELLVGLARYMKSDFVEHLLPHLRTAAGERASLLLCLLQHADPTWVTLPEAESVVRNHLQHPTIGRVALMLCLAESKNLQRFVPILEQHPPSSTEEWSALGRSGATSEKLSDYALSLLAAHPATLLYLIRIDPLPEAVSLLMMSCARGEWIANALEISVADGLHTRRLLPLVEHAVRLGGTTFSAALAWISTAKLSRELLAALREAMTTNTTTRDIDPTLWIRRNTCSSERALRAGRAGQAPSLHDAAALVRETVGQKGAELAKEILEKPHPQLIERVLYPLCATNAFAARQVVQLCADTRTDVSRRAQQLCARQDVRWPEPGAE